MIHKNVIRAFLIAWGIFLIPVVCGASVIIAGALTYEFTVTPGGSYEGSIEVRNTDDSPQEIKAYQTDYFFYADGRVLYGDPGLLARSNARWIVISPKQVRIPARSSVSIHYSILTPNDTTMKGTYWSVIMIEPVAEGSPESSGKISGAAVGVSQLMRYAVQIVTHVGETGARQLKFSQIRLVTENQMRALVVDVENTGERWLRGSLWADLYDSLGVYAGKFEGEKQRIYPGTSVRYTLELADVRGSSYKALVVVDCGGDDVFGVNVNLVLAK